MKSKLNGKTRTAFCGGVVVVFVGVVGIVVVGVGVVVVATKHHSLLQHPVICTHDNGHMLDIIDLFTCSGRPAAATKLHSLLQHLVIGTHDNGHMLDVFDTFTCSGRPAAEMRRSRSQ